MSHRYESYLDLYSLFRIVTDYLIGQENTTLYYDCVQSVSITLLVTLVDFDGNTVIEPYSMRSGSDQNLYRGHMITVRHVITVVI